MSLISEALKKAQRSRTGEVPAEGDGATAIPRRGSSPANRQVILIAGAVVVAVILAAAAAIALLRPDPDEIAQRVAEATAREQPQPPAAQPEPLPAPVSAAPEAAADSRNGATPPLITFNVPEAAPTPAPPKAEPAEPAVPAVPATPTVEVSPEEQETIQAFVDSLQVSGVRSSDGDSKVLMNDTVYRVDDIVSRTLGLRLTTVAVNSLTFTDRAGNTYKKNF